MLSDSGKETVGEMKDLFESCAPSSTGLTRGYLNTGPSAQDTLGGNVNHKPALLLRIFFFLAVTFSFGTLCSANSRLSFKWP